MNQDAASTNYKRKNLLKNHTLVQVIAESHAIGGPRLLNHTSCAIFYPAVSMANEGSQ